MENLGYPPPKLVAESCGCDTDDSQYVFSVGGFKDSTKFVLLSRNLRNRPAAQICNDINASTTIQYDCSTFRLSFVFCSIEGLTQQCDPSRPETSSQQAQQTDPGKVACTWGVGFQRNSNGTWAKNAAFILADKAFSTVRWGVNVEPSAIHPRLQLNDDKGKILIETQFRLTSGSARDAFGLRMVNPKPSTSSNDTFFSSVVIFQPRSGLFSTNVPK